MLLQFVLLSMLLHLLVVLVFGTSTNGGARRGDGWHGSARCNAAAVVAGARFQLHAGTGRRRATVRRCAAAAHGWRDDGAGHVATGQGRGAGRAARDARVCRRCPHHRPHRRKSAKRFRKFRSRRRPPPVEALPRLDRTAPEEVDKPLSHAGSHAAESCAAAGGEGSRTAGVRAAALGAARADRAAEGRAASHSGHRASAARGARRATCATGRVQVARGYRHPRRSRRPRPRKSSANRRLPRK